MTQSPTLHRHAGIITVGWGIVFTIVHVYWALGGGGGLSDDGDASLAASLYVGFIALLGLVGTLVAYGLSREALDEARRRTLRILARTGGIALLVGVLIGVGRWVADGSLGDDGAAGIIITAYFLIGGLLYSLLGWGGGISTADTSRNPLLSRTPSTDRR